jgi:hypothetical protein
VLADPAASAFLALVLAAAVLADAAASTFLALDLPAVVQAEQLPMAVPAHWTAAPGTGAAATVVDSASVSADVTTGVPYQPVDQLLLLPSFRQSRFRAELLQLRDGLRAGTQNASVMGQG